MVSSSERSVVDRPIFIVGCGRSGTTLLYDMLALHPDLAWFSSYVQRVPHRPELALLSRLHAVGPLRRSHLSWIPRPREGHAIWDATRVAQPGDNGPLVAADVTASDARAMRRTVSRVVRFHGRPRFMNKNTRNARRILFLDAVFPDAHFVHVVRDPRATVASLLRVAFWPDLPIWWVDNRTPRELVDEGMSAVALAAEFWAREVAQVLDDLSNLDESRSTTVAYEDLVKNPIAEVGRVLDRTDLSRDPHVFEALAEHHASSRNDKFRRDFDNEQLAQIEGIAGSVAARCGYELA